MGKAFIFPGQGSQYVGMAKDFFEKSNNAKELIKTAEEKLEFPISSIMFNGPEDQLKLTNITQPAIFLHSLLILNEICKFNVNAVAGHSLGEYSALVANNALDPIDALFLVKKRGEAMLAAGIKHQGTMAAIIGINSNELEMMCTEVSKENIVQCANYNSPGQIVISGTIEGVKKVMSLAKQNKAKLIKELVVSGAFHSSLMEVAKFELQKALNLIKINDTLIPVYCNVSAEPVISKEEIKTNLLEQLTSPVRWEQTINNMISDGIDEFIEIGPGNVLQGLVKRINPKVKILGIDKFEDLQKIS